MENSDSFEDALGDIDAAATVTGLLWDASASFHSSGDAILNGALSPSALPTQRSGTHLRRPYATSLKVFRRHMLSTLLTAACRLKLKN